MAAIGCFIMFMHTRLRNVLILVNRTVAPRFTVISPVWPPSL